MTEEDLEKKLKDYSNKIFWQVYKEGREINTVDISNAYKDGYEQGQKDNCETHKECQFLKYFEKENEELKAQIEELKAIFEIVCKERYGYAWEMRKSDLIEKLKRRIEK